MFENVIKQIELIASKYGFSVSGDLGGIVELYYVKEDNTVTCIDIVVPENVEEDIEGWLYKFNIDDFDTNYWNLLPSEVKEQWKKMAIEIDQIIIPENETNIELV